MALDAAGVSSVALADVLFQDVQMYLTDEAVILPTITDLTARVSQGRKSVAVPRTSGLGFSNVNQDGNQATAGGMTVAADTLNLDQFKEVPEYIFELADEQSRVDLKAAFLDAAPRVYAEGIEAAIATALAGASAAAPDHILQFSEATNTRPSLDDISEAQRLLDEAKVPGTDRWLLVSPAIKQHLVKKTELRDASQAGGNTALSNGEFAQLHGFRIIMSNQIAANTMIAYHRSACAFAMGREIEYIEEPQRSYGREFVSIRGSYGVKILDSGKRCVLFNSTGA